MSPTKLLIPRDYQVGKCYLAKWKDNDNDLWIFTPIEKHDVHITCKDIMIIKGDTPMDEYDIYYDTKQPFEIVKEVSKETNPEYFL